MAASRQIRLLLWKDYLMRKRNPITLAGIVWGTLVMISLYIVRINVDNQDFPTCQFPARALPSAGILTFLQSFICSVNNECLPMDQFEEIPSYANSKLTELRRHFSPLFSNSSFLDTAAMAPDAMKLLATLSDVADVPEFMHIAKNGLRVKELFRNPNKAKRYLSQRMELGEPIANSLMTSDLSLEGIMQGTFNICDPESISKTIKMNNVTHLDAFVRKLCSLSSKETQRVSMDLLLECDLGKYLQMLGNMYYKLSKDDRLTELGKMVAAVLNMMSLQSFLPVEITAIFQGETPDFSYIDLDVVSNVLDYFEPNLGDTESYKSMRNFAESSVVVIKYLNKFLEKQRKYSGVTDSLNEVSKHVNIKSAVESVSNIFSNAMEVFDDFAGNGTTIDIFNIMSQLMNFVHKWLPDKTKHDVLFYATLVTKLIEGTDKVIFINVYLEELVYNVSMRHPLGVKTLLDLPPGVFGNGLDALTDAERTQMLTSNLNSPGEMFCDNNKLKNFFNVKNEEAVTLHDLLCTASWKDYIIDLISTFGIYEVKNNINTMASLFIQETLGKDTTSRLYTLEHDFQVLKNFTRALDKIDSQIPTVVNWSNIFDVDKNLEFMKIIRDKRNLGNQILVTVHGALAKEVVKQNPILEFKIAPFIIDATTVIAALNDEIDETPQDVADATKKLYPQILRTILTTALDETKTYKLLSTYSLDTMCTGVDNASLYLSFPTNTDKIGVTTAICDISKIFEKMLKKNSHLGKAVGLIMSSKDNELFGIQWTKLITDLKTLYVKMTLFYPYLLEYRSYGMADNTRSEVATLFKKVKAYWFKTKHLDRSIRLGIKLTLEILDLMDREIFDMKSEIWSQLKYIFSVVSGPLSVIDDLVKLIGAIWKNESFISTLPAATVISLSKIIPNAAQFIYEGTDIIVEGHIKVEPIIEIMNANISWPCSSTSLADLLPLSDTSKETLRALETMLCMPQDVQKDWISYLKSRNTHKLEHQTRNSTDFGPHVFLRFSAAFDALIDDSYILKDILMDALDETPGRLTLMTAWKHAVESFNTTNRDNILRKLFFKVDKVLNSIEVKVKGGVPLNTVWRNFVRCSSEELLEDGCREIGRATWLNILKFLSVTMSNVAGDLLNYFREINEPDSNILQLAGFTKKTGLYLLYERLPDFLGVLANSYGDYGFMTQIRRAGLSNFWDCEAVVQNLKPAPGSLIDDTIIRRVQPFVCPSLLYWISLPRGDNAILDVVAKPQYYFFTSLLDDLNSTFVDAYMNTNDLKNFITELSYNTTITQETINIEKLREKLTKSLDKLLSHKINGSNPTYNMFNEGNKKLVQSQICAMKYNLILSKYGSNVDNDFENAKTSLTNLVNVLRNDDKEIVSNISEFLKSRKGVVNFFKASIEYAFDLGVPVYLKYLQNNIQHNNVILTFLSGGNWWQKMRELYNGTHATNFFNNIEKTFDIAEDVLNNLDKIHWFRLIREINSNGKEVFCKSTVALSEYVPDNTGALASLKQQFCLQDTAQLFMELMPLRFASQVYDNKLKITTDVDYDALNSDISDAESNIKKIFNGPKSPQTPKWVTDEKLEKFRTSVIGLLSKETLIKASFGTLGNIVDAGTLLLNNSQCTLCSQFTTWMKQLNLQLYKKQEYDNLLCQMHEMSLHDIYVTLKHDFHWDMAIKELISTRNYTKFELNKAMSEFLEQVKQHLLEDVTAPTTKTSQCLTQNVTRNAFGNATLFANVLAHTLRLIRAELPHVQEIEGVKEIKYLKELQGAVAHKLDVKVPLKKYLNEAYDFSKKLKLYVNNDNLVKEVENSAVNLRTIQNLEPQSLIFEKSDYTWEDLCECCDCNKVVTDIVENLNTTLVFTDLQVLQDEEFWRFNFVSNILERVEDIIGHASRLIGVVSKVDLVGVMEGRLVSIIDTAVQLLTDEVLNSIIYSIRGLMVELNPLIKSDKLRDSLFDISEGLEVLQESKNSLLEEDIKVQVGDLFSDPDKLEADLSNLGINNTNFWSIAAPRIQVGYFQFKPMFSTKQDAFRISNFVCEMEDMAKVIVPGNVDVVTLDDIYGAVIEQFCDLDEETAKQILATLVKNIDFTFVINKVKDWLLSELYSTSELTPSEGERIMNSFSRITSLIPVMQNNIGSVSDLMADEPLLEYLKGDFSFGSLFGGGGFMADAGRMVCGKPFNTHVNRLFKSIIETQDLSGDADSEQLEVLPTDFCRSLYKQIVSVNGGKIVWSFVKPLVMGKILYTPTTPVVERIIQRANESFAPMVKTVNLVHSFAGAFSSVEKLVAHRKGLEALKELLTAPGTKQLRTSVIGETEIPDFDIEDMFDKLGDVQDLGGLLQKGSDILECVNLNRFMPVSDEQQLSKDALKLMRVNEFSAGLVFLNNETSPEMPLNVQYKIRMDIENTPTTNRLRNYLWIPGPESNFIENMRYFRGFIQIQDIIDKAIIDISASGKRLQKRGLGDDQSLNWAMYTQQTPYPCYRKDFFQTSLYESQSLIVTFFFALLFTTSSVVRFIVSDKETGNTMLMSVMGVNLAYHTLSWFLSSLVEMLITSTFIATVLSAGGVLPRTAPSMIFMLLFIYSFAVLSFCYMMSKLFKTASFAAVCSGMAYLISFMPFVLILSLEAVLTSSLKMLVCLSMSSSLCYAFLYITRYEATGLGAQWVHLWESPDGVDNMSIGIAAILVFVDGVIYILIGLLLDRFYGFKAEQNNVANCKDSGEKAGVSIINISKVYGSGTRSKLALDNVSIELHTGQITSLLGHNGAGKTTLIKILTGMLRPTKGHVVVRSESSGTMIGVCPQKDVLLLQLTAREHVALYAQLKSGRSLDELHGEVESILRVLSLGPVAEEPVARLSGGTRRRLCVALAFVAEPGLVVLDEPTAGVDPAARRDIWSMILKLRENRTILLTTHHLDEAELLSDQIVIMHKGQVHTTGSPIEIKRGLGSGYKLTVMYPEGKRKLEGLQEFIDDDLCMEERTKLLLATVRNVIKNANLVDVNGLEVELNLPFFDADGVSNDYLQLCTMLESSQSVLGFQSFNMDCSSLEQVFFTICHQADSPQQVVELDVPSKSASTSSLRNDRAPLVPAEGPLVGSAWDQFLALLYARYLHYTRNKSLLFMLLILPSLFVIIAMAFSNIRPPANNEIALQLHRDLYRNTTEFLIKTPSIESDGISPVFAEEVMAVLKQEKQARNWTLKDNPVCECLDTKQQCDLSDVDTTNLPEMMLFSDVKTLNDWLIASQEVYIEKRYGGYSANTKSNMSNLVVWYNNKGHHAMPAYLNALNNAVLKVVTGRHNANITTYTHPLKISNEPINKDTVYQHIADAGITAMLLIAYSLVSAGGAIYLVTARCSQEKRLQLLAGVTPALYWTTALVWDMIIILINIFITAMVLQAFHFPVFVTKSNLSAICLLILLYGYGCAGVVHVTEKLFSQPSLANMILFCANTFVGVVGITLLLILDVISESDATDNARWILHKVFLLCPQFALGDGVLEVAKNTIRAQVLSQFGMDTYRDPLFSDLIVLHYSSLVLVGTVLFLMNLAIEYDCFEALFVKFRSETIEPLPGSDLDPEVLEERRRVLASRTPLRLHTIGNINAGYLETEEKNSIKSGTWLESDVAQCERLGKAYPALGGRRVAVRDLTLGIPPGQCTALLGQNGAGKSTAFSMLTGEIRPTSGSIYLNDRRVDPRDLCQGLISYCPQSDAIDPLLTVRETLKFYCKLRSITDEKEVIRRTIDMFDLAKYADVRSGTLSGGNKRKLCTAIAFMGRTPLVLLDEPTSGMDPASRACVSRGVRLACASGRGVLLSTHALEDARRLAARVALLQAAALRALAPLDRCLRRFGGGQAVWCRVRGGGSVRAVWRRVRAAAPQAQLQVLHSSALHFLLPTHANVDGKEITTKLSDVFRLTAELFTSGDIEDFTVNQSSLDQMFLNFAGSSRSRGTELEVLGTPPASPYHSCEDLSAVTAL
ncbi:unnamed protein product, partial [Iphiclides podalirius]